jgi:hypothetical protein
MDQFTQEPEKLDCKIFFSDLEELKKQEIDMREFVMSKCEAFYYNWDSLI